MGYLRLRTYNTCFTLPLLALNAVKQRKGFLSLGYAYRMEKCAGKTFYERKNPVVLRYVRHTRKNRDEGKILAGGTYG